MIDHSYDYVSFGPPEWGNAQGFGPETFRTNLLVEDDPYLDDYFYEEYSTDPYEEEDDFWDDVMAIETGLL